MKPLINDEFFSRLEAIALHFRNNLAGYFGGKHRTRTYGQTVEFADYREYMMGDDIRRIDWNLYSRFEKYFLKLFTDERQMHMQIFIDCSASMSDPAKSSYAVGAAAALGYLSVHNMDKVSFKLIRGGASEELGGTIVGKTSFFKAISSLEKIKFDGDANLADAITSTANPGLNDGVTVIISDFFTESDWKKAIDFLTFKKRQVMLLQVLSPEEIDPLYNGRVNLIDSESVDISDPKNMKIRITRSWQKAYEEAFNDLQENLRSFCVSRGADFLSLRTDEPIERLLFEKLLKVGMIE